MEEKKGDGEDQFSVNFDGAMKDESRYHPVDKIPSGAVPRSVIRSSRKG